MTQRMPRVCPVRVSEMRVATVHQPPRQSRVDYLAANLDFAKLGLPTMAQLDGVFWLIDGLHRILALQQRGFWGRKIDCAVYEVATEAEIALFFLKSPCQPQISRAMCSRVEREVNGNQS